jgi:hypothetical protein
MNLELTDEPTEALIREIDQIVRNDRYFHGPRIRVLRDILGKLRPEPARPIAAPAAELRAAEQGEISETAVEPAPSVHAPGEFASPKNRAAYKLEQMWTLSTYLSAVPH